MLFQQRWETSPRDPPLETYTFRQQRADPAGCIYVLICSYAYVTAIVKEEEACEFERQCSMYMGGAVGEEDEVMIF